MPEILLPYLLLALGLVASLSLFLCLKREIYFQDRKQREKMEGMSAQLQSVAEQEPVPAISPPPHSGFNLSRRVQALRLLRRGEDVAHIAAALGAPEREIELLVRVQRLAAESPTPN